MRQINWPEIYKPLEKVTPLLEDCGRLCNKKCCSLKESGKGVYLFPGEEVLFENDKSWCQIRDASEVSNYYTGEESLILDCTGECPRGKRPLVCRIFPMAPYLDQKGRLEVIFDPEAFFICPLVRLGDKAVLNSDFIEKVLQVWLDLIKNKEIRDRVEKYSERLDSEAKEPWKMLFEHEEK
ncbi:MAG: hypothetical protein HGA27_04080 [Peptococcaceae bacterium]|nr:hypothetical protein [Peptococcaceae bacterium]